MSRLKMFFWMLLCSLLMGGAVIGFALAWAAMQAMAASNALSGALN